MFSKGENIEVYFIEMEMCGTQDQYWADRWIGYQREKK